MLWSATLPPSTDSIATAAAMIGASTLCEMRVPNCPASATGLSGVMLTVEEPMRSSAA